MMTKFWKKLASVSVLLGLMGTASAEEGKLLDKVNDDIPGTLSGQLRLSAMQRNPDGTNGRGWSISSSILLNYKSEEYAGFIGELEYVYADVIDEGGSYDNPLGPAHSLTLNDDLSLLTKANLTLNLEKLGLDNASFKVGRFALANSFSSTYHARHKDQTMDGMLFTCKPNDIFEFSAGHIEKYSSYFPARIEPEGLGDGTRDVEELVSGNANIQNTSGIQFAEMSLKSKEGIALTLYDWYAHDLINSYGVRFVYPYMKNEDMSSTFKAHCIFQNDIGDNLMGDKAVDAYILSNKITMGKFYIEPSLMMVSGDQAKNTLVDPFYGDVALNKALLGRTRFKDAGADNYYLFAGYAWEKTSIHFLYVYANQDGINMAEDQEFNVILKQKVNANLSGYTSFSYAEQDNDNGTLDTRTGIRLFVDYKF